MSDSIVLGIHWLTYTSFLLLFSELGFFKTKNVKNHEKLYSSAYYWSFFGGINLKRVILHLKSENTSETKKYYPHAPSKSTYIMRYYFLKKTSRFRGRLSRYSIRSSFLSFLTVSAGNCSRATPCNKRAVSSSENSSLPSIHCKKSLFSGQII